MEKPVIEVTTTDTEVSNETETGLDTTGKSAEELTALNEKLYKELKSVRTEAKERRIKLEAFEKEAQVKAEAELTYQERFNKLNEEFTNYKSTITKQTLENQFTTSLIEKGLPSKIAKIAVPKDLSEDNMEEHLKTSIKEYGEFIIKVSEDDKKAQPINPFSIAQPSQPSKKVSKMPTNSEVWAEVNAKMRN